MMSRMLRSHAVRLGASRLSNNYAAAVVSRPFVASQLTRTMSLQADLLAKVEREYKEESQPERLEVEPELKEVRGHVKGEGWKITDEVALTKMFRTTDKFKIQLSFHCQDVVRAGTDDYGEDEEDARNQDNEKDPDMFDEGDAVRFTVTATPLNGGKTLYFSCLSEYAVARIEGMALVEPENIEKVHTSSQVFNNTDYHGPDFSELAEDLTETMSEFLADDLGVDGNVATFIAMHSDRKEQELYVQFLSDVKKILA